MSVFSEPLKILQQQELLAAYKHTANVFEKIAKGEIQTLLPILGTVFNLHNKPLSLENHFPFEEMYLLKQPARMVWMTARQVAKTSNIAFHNVLLAASIPNMHCIFVTPLYEQTRRLSSLYVAPAINESPFRDLWIGSSQSVLQRTLRNGSRLMFTFAYTDATRTRGHTGSRLIVDEAQSMLLSLLPIIRETISHGLHGELEVYTGTPLTTDNTLSVLFEETSQAEWGIPCTHCTVNGHTTWNFPSLDQHLDKMIGPYHEHISEQYPGTICYNCRQPISPRLGRWFHRFPERRWEAAGYHFPQIILPHHYASPKRWARILAKQRGLGPTPTNVFYNEVLGVPYDRSAKLVSKTELQEVSNLCANSIEAARPFVKAARIAALGVDWGGGGEDETSLTTLALVCLNYDGSINVPWGLRLLTPHDPIREAIEVRNCWNALKPTILAHDYAAGGALHETFLVQAGLSLNQIMPCVYVRTAKSAPCYRVAPTPHHPRNHYRVDKARVLQLVCTMIKLKQIRFFNYDAQSEFDPGLINDFLALREEKTKLVSASEVYRITKTRGKIDDFAQAVTFGCTAVWYATNHWPNLVDPKYVITPQQEAEIEPAEIDFKTE